MKISILRIVSVFLVIGAASPAIKAEEIAHPAAAVSCHTQMDQLVNHNQRVDSSIKSLVTAMSQRAHGADSAQLMTEFLLQTTNDHLANIAKFNQDSLLPDMSTPSNVSTRAVDLTKTLAQNLEDAKASVETPNGLSRLWKSKPEFHPQTLKGTLGKIETVTPLLEAENKTLLETYEKVNVKYETLTSEIAFINQLIEKLSLEEIKDSNSAQVREEIHNHISPKLIKYVMDMRQLQRVMAFSLESLKHKKNTNTLTLEEIRRLTQVALPAVLAAQPKLAAFLAKKPEPKPEPKPDELPPPPPKVQTPPPPPPKVEPPLPVCIKDDVCVGGRVAFLRQDSQSGGTVSEVLPDGRIKLHYSDRGYQETAILYRSQIALTDPTLEMKRYGAVYKPGNVVFFHRDKVELVGKIMGIFPDGTLAVIWDGQPGIHEVGAEDVFLAKGRLYDLVFGEKILVTGKGHPLGSARIIGINYFTKLFLVRYLGSGQEIAIEGNYIKKANVDGSFSD